MGATGVAFLWTGSDQIRSGRDMRKVAIRVFFSDKKDKPRGRRRYEIRRTGEDETRQYVPDSGGGLVAKVGRETVLSAFKKRRGRWVR